MLFTATAIHSVFLIELQKMPDERGFFARSWCKREFDEHGLNSRLVQCNVSFNARKGTLRGMHYQVRPFEEAKVMQCTKGSVYVVVVDLRSGSATRRRSIGIELSAENRKMLYVPEGCANGYLTLADNSEIFYQMSEFYSPESYRGFRWDDPYFGIAWPSQPLVMSDRDRTYPDYTPAVDYQTLSAQSEKRRTDAEMSGGEMYALIETLFPVCRSITGNGLRQTLCILRDHVPLKIHEVPTGTQVLDWKVPKEWNISDAYVKDPSGEKVIDFQRSNLHVLNYSIPVKDFMTLGELKKHLFSLPAYPHRIPYRTSYYTERWGFCLSHESLLSLNEGMYEVVIDSTLENGSLSYGELYIKGRTDDEVLISSHCCHPSLANDNLSGVSVAIALAKQLLQTSNRLSYRFLFIPGTIGAITWLAQNEGRLHNIKHGLVLAGVGNPGGITYKKSRHGNAEIDRAAQQVLHQAGEQHKVIEFYPYGYDERQYCSPGFNLPVGRLSRKPYNQYPEYHTSSDNLEFVRQELLEESYSIVSDMVFVLENNQTYINMSPKGEPQLGRRGLYSGAGASEMAMLWMLNLSDGSHDLLEIAGRSGIGFPAVHRASQQLLASGLLEEKQSGCH